MKKQTFINLAIFIIGIVAFLITRYYVSTIENFDSQESDPSAENKCSALTSCGTCTTMDGCGWCAGSQTCVAAGSGCPAQAEEYIVQTLQCPSTATLGQTDTSKTLTYDEVRENRRMELIKKYTDRIATNMSALVKPENKDAMKTYMEKNLGSD